LQALEYLTIDEHINNNNVETFRKIIENSKKSLKSLEIKRYINIPELLTLLRELNPHKVKHLQFSTNNNQILPTYPIVEMRKLKSFDTSSDIDVVEIMTQLPSLKHLKLNQRE
jgi:hypothetical protein